MNGIPRTEGRLPFRGHKTWFRIYGNGEVLGQNPIVVIHGGPGASHDHLDTLADLARSGRRVILFDHLGGGLSDQPADESWSLELFIDEVEALRRTLNIRGFHLLGHDWGGMVALEYALRKPEGLAGLVLSSTSPSMPRWTEAKRGLVSELPDELAVALLDDAGALNPSLTRKTALRTFRERHVCRMLPWPRGLERSLADLEVAPAVAQALVGPDEIAVDGALKDWDVTDRLGEVEAKTLVTAGHFDHATEQIAEELADAVPDGRLEVFAHSSHTPHIEEQIRYIVAVERFLDEVDNPQGNRARSNSQRTVKLWSGGGA